MKHPLAATQMHRPIFMQRFGRSNFAGRRLDGLTFPAGSGYELFRNRGIYSAWPWEAGKQQQMAHIDFPADHLEEAVAHACQCGGVQPGVQLFEASVTRFDPEDRPFCLSTVKQ